MTKYLVILVMLTLSLAIGCNDDDDNTTPTPVPTTPVMTATETALLGTWIQDSMIYYDGNGLLLHVINRVNHTYNYYVNGVYSHAIVNNDYYYLTFSNTPWGATAGYYKLYNNNNGNTSESPWNVQTNYGGTGKDYVGSVGYIYSFTSTQIEFRTSTNPTLASTVIYYCHKQ